MNNAIVLAQDLVDGVCSEQNFGEAIRERIGRALEVGVVVVKCRRGKHRSPVVAAFAAEILSEVMHFDVKVMEATLRK